MFVLFMKHSPVLSSQSFSHMFYCRDFAILICLSERSPFNSVIWAADLLPPKFRNENLCIEGAMVTGLCVWGEKLVNHRKWNSCFGSSIPTFKKMYLCTTCKIKIKITVASV